MVHSSAGGDSGFVPQYLAVAQVSRHVQSSTAPCQAASLSSLTSGSGVDAIQFRRLDVVPGRCLPIRDLMVYAIVVDCGHGEMSEANSMHHHTIVCWLSHTSNCQIADIDHGWGTDRTLTGVLRLDVTSTCHAHGLLPGISYFRKPAIAGCKLGVDCFDVGIGYISSVKLVDSSRPPCQVDIFLRVLVPNVMLVADTHSCVNTDTSPYVVAVMPEHVVTPPPSCSHQVGTEMHVPSWLLWSAVVSGVVFSVLDVILGLAVRSSSTRRDG